MTYGGGWSCWQPTDIEGGLSPQGDVTYSSQSLSDMFALQDPPTMEEALGRVSRRAVAMLIMCASVAAVPESCRDRRRDARTGLAALLAEADAKAALV